MDLYVNARFLPMTGEHDTFEAMLVGDDGTIAFTGSLEQARDRAAQLRRTASGSPVRQIDCEGHCVMPGLIDPHSHFSGATQYFTAADLSDAQSFDDVTRLLTDFARRRGWLTATDEAAPAHADDGVILIGVGLDDTHLDEHRMPDRVVLDRVSATLPVVVNHVSGHNLACNTRMLQLAGVTADTPDPTGGRYLREADGAPDGRCVEPPAMSPVFTYIQSHQRLDMHALVGDMQTSTLRTASPPCRMALPPRMTSPRSPTSPIMADSAWIWSPTRCSARMWMACSVNSHGTIPSPTTAGSASADASCSWMAPHRHAPRG